MCTPAAKTTHLEIEEHLHAVSKELSKVVKLCHDENDSFCVARNLAMFLAITPLAEAFSEFRQLNFKAMADDLSNVERLRLADRFKPGKDREAWLADTWRTTSAGEDQEAPHD